MQRTLRIGVTGGPDLQGPVGPVWFVLVQCRIGIVKFGPAGT